MAKISLTDGHRESRHGTFLVLLTYSLSNIALLSFPRAVFWDDWTLYGVGLEAIIKQFTAAGHPLAGYINWGLTLLGPGGVRVLVFFLGFLSALLWLQILRQTPGIDARALHLSVAVSVSLPFFLARVATINTISLLALALFLLGWLKTANQDFKKPVGISWSGISMVFLSGLLYAGFIPMVILVVLHSALLLRRLGRRVPWRRLILIPTCTLAVHGLVVLLRRQIFPPSNGFESYRSISVGTGQLALLFTGLFLVFALVFLLLRRDDRGTARGLSGSLELAVLGVISFLLAISPFVLIGKYPPFAEWQTRYEVVFFVPATLLLIAMLQSVAGHLKRSGSLLVAPLILAIVVYSNFQLSRFYVDWAKHSYIAEMFRERNPATQGQVILVADETQNWNAMSRSLRYYEWTGMFAEAAQVKDILALGGRDAETLLDSYLEGGFNRAMSAPYNDRWKDHTLADQAILVTIQKKEGISCGLPHLSVRNCLSVNFSSQTIGSG